MVDLTQPIAQPDARPLTHVERGQLIAIQTQARVEKIRAARAAAEKEEPTP